MTLRNHNLMTMKTWMIVGAVIGTVATLSLATPAFAGPGDRGGRGPDVRGRDNHGPEVRGHDRGFVAPVIRGPDVRVGFGFNVAPAVERVWVPAVVQEQAVQVWVEPVYGTQNVQVFVPAATRTVTDRVWVEPVTQTVTQNVLVPARYEDRTFSRYEGRRIVTYRQSVLVENAHYETQTRQVIVTPGYWNTVQRQEVVAAHYETQCQQVLVTPGHYETQVQQVEVCAGHWEDRVRPSFGFSIGVRP